MRSVYALAALAALSFAPTASADSRSVPGPGLITQLLLLDGYRAAPPAPLNSPASASAKPSTGSTTAEAPEETLTEVVQRMWSQVRAYRRPGGAEVLLRGNF